MSKAKRRSSPPARKRAAPRKGTAGRRGRTGAAGKPPGALLWLGAGAAAWVVWNLTKPSEASAAESSSTTSTSNTSSTSNTTNYLPSGSSPGSTSPPQPGDPYPSWALLSSGAQGGNVKLWQQTLIKGGFLPNEPKSADGIFGPLTTAATKLLQTKAGAVADGIVGPITRAAAHDLGLW